MICHLKTTISWYIVLSIIIAFLQTKASCVFKNNFNNGAELCHLNIQYMKKTPFLKISLPYAGRRRILTYASIVFSVLSSLLALVPFLYIWAILRDVLRVVPDYSRAVNVERYGWIGVIFAIVSMLVFDWRMGLLCIATIVIALVVMVSLMTGASLKRKMTEYNAALDAMSNEAVEYVRGIPVVKTFGQSVFFSNVSRRLSTTIKNGVSHILTKCGYP